MNLEELDQAYNWDMAENWSLYQTRLDLDIFDIDIQKTTVLAGISVFAFDSTRRKRSIN